MRLIIVLALLISFCSQALAGVVIYSGATAYVVPPRTESFEAATWPVGDLGLTWSGGDRVAGGAYGYWQLTSGNCSGTSLTKTNVSAGYLSCSIYVSGDTDVGDGGVSITGATNTGYPAWGIPAQIPYNAGTNTYYFTANCSYEGVPGELYLDNCVWSTD